MVVVAVSLTPGQRPRVAFTSLYSTRVTGSVVLDFAERMGLLYMMSVRPTFTQPVYLVGCRANRSESVTNIFI